MDALKTLWDSLNNADSWEDASLLAAILLTFVTSLLFSIRMFHYKGKTLLDTMIMFREFGWAFLAFRYVTALGLDWSWQGYSWIVWTYIAVTTGLTYLASIREHFLGNRAREKENEHVE